MDFVLGNIVVILLLVFYLYTWISTITVLIMENRNPIRSISWVIVLVFLPVLGLFFYFIFGQNLRQRKKINALSIRKQESRYKDLQQLELLNKSETSTNITNLIRLFQNENESIAYANSKIDIYAEPQETFEKIFEDLAKAKDHIHIEFYIIANDLIGNRLRELLIEKASQGVQVRVIYDYWGCFDLTKKFFLSMKEAGIHFHAFFPPKFPFVLSKINYRNHRKIVVVDGKVGYTGGVNMANRYFIGDSLGLWRDTMVRFEGSAVYGLQEAFLNDWYFVDRVMLTKKKYFPKQDVFGKNLVQIVDSGPDTKFQSIMHGIYYALTTAQDYVYIHTPYFMPPDEILSAIQTAALRGVDVRLLIPTRSDTSMARASNCSYIETMLNAGARVYWYLNGFLHSKAIVVDDMISTIGTANMDFRSYEQNFEINAFIYEKETAQKLKELFLQDLEHSTEVTKEEWEQRPKIQRVKESLSRLFSPIM